MFNAGLDADIQVTLGRLGFRFGDKGTHSSRTMMFNELDCLLNAVAGAVERSDYDKAVLKDNCLGKQTRSCCMGRIEKLAERYRHHVSLPWQKGLAGAQRAIFVVYDKTDERRLANRIELFALATAEANHAWKKVDLSNVFSQWMAGIDSSITLKAILSHLKTLN